MISFLMVNIKNNLLSDIENILTKKKKKGDIENIISQIQNSIHIYYNPPFYFYNFTSSTQNF